MSEYKDSYGYGDEDQLTEEEERQYREFLERALQGESNFTRAMRAVNGNPNVVMTLKTGGWEQTVSLDKETSIEFLKIFHTYIKPGFVPPDRAAKDIVAMGIHAIMGALAQGAVAQALLAHALSDLSPEIQQAAQVASVRKTLERLKKSEDEFIDSILNGDNSNEQNEGTD